MEKVSERSVHHITVPLFGAQRTLKIFSRQMLQYKERKCKSISGEGVLETNDNYENVNKSLFHILYEQRKFDE